MCSIKEVLMIRDGMTSDEADDLIVEARTQFNEYLAQGLTCAAWDVCQEFFGLEPDYVMELIN